ncbi:hypothetical protein CK203_111981 [Vitis vinifera]|uniref:Ubiquitin-like protease family profile domain-containing protein n=1 Tax=Vitis vinifera TaxID=29760 RepID=A0A438DNW5_VITVI|nr:hypothetical protein CK203_111981 [Vitis vinifera]
MSTNVAIPVTLKDVNEVIGIPDNGVDIVVYNSRRQTGYAISPPQALVNVKAHKDEVSTDIHPCNDQFMGHSIDSLRTHSPMENDTTTAIDDSPLLGQHSGALSNYGANFDSPKEVGINAEEGSNNKPVILTSRYDCGMFVIKYMQYWNGATLAHSLTEDKMHLYRLRLVVNLLMNEVNNTRDKVM